ncbi:MAG: HTTM domain-containing protein [Planctomycetaceae bacterium]
MDHSQTTAPLRQRLQQFFYADEVPYNLALVRICLPLNLLVVGVSRWFHARELFSLDGAPAPLWENFGYPEMLPIPGAAAAVALTTLYVVTLATLCLGWMTRTSAFLAAVLTAYLSMLDTTGTITKFTVICTHVLLLLSLSACGSVWSIDAWVAQRRRPTSPGETGGGYPRAAVWPRRLIQLLMAIVYFGAAITKVQTPAFFSGDQMYFWLITNVNYHNPIGEYASLWPPMIVAMALATVVWEFSFPFLCWRGLPKAALLTVGAVFHLLTIVMLGLLVFPFICLSIYWAFFDEADIQRLAAWLRRQGRRWPSFASVVRAGSLGQLARPAWLSPSLAASGFALLCAVTIGLGLEVERRLDVYGRHSPQGPHQLQPMDAKLAARMLRGYERTRYFDLVQTFDVGTRTLAGFLANRQTEFQSGDEAVVECSVIPPHGDLWMECNLHDSEDRLIHRETQLLVREKFRTHFGYTWKESYAAGDYDLVLKLDGEEVARRRIHLTHSTSPAESPPATAMLR